MTAQGWTETSRGEYNPLNSVASLLRGAVRGDSLELMMAAAARELLDAGTADRAGVWLLSGRQGDASRTLDGVVVENGGNLIPEQWMCLDPALPDLKDLLECSAEDILVGRADPAHALLCQLAGNTKALWLTLRAAGEPLGLALVAWRSETAPVEIAPLRVLADAMAIAGSEHRSRDVHSRQRDFLGSSDGLRARALHAEAQLVSVAEAADAGLVVFDTRANVRLVNERFVQLLGISRQTMVASQTWESLAQTVSRHFQEPAAFLERWRDLAEHPGEASCEELELLTPSPRRVERFTRPVLNAGGELLGRLEVYRDVTARRIAQSRSIQTEKMAALGQLVSGIAHELNNPLTSIMGYSQLLLGRRLSAPQAADGRLIYQEAERAARIVKNLLLFAREARPERQAVNLNEILERTVALRDYELRVENIELEKHLDPHLPPVNGDAAQLQQVLLNLLVNAEQAIRQGSSEGRISIHTRRSPQGRVSFDITDTGPGIPAETLPRIFDPFFSTKAAGAGTGLGLSITYSIVQEHGGLISVESKPGQGAKFTIELPAAAHEVAVVPETPPRRRRVEDALRTARSARVLVIEDEPTVAHLIADVLGEEGHPVEIVLDGRDGLNRVITGEHDLVICDLRMPHLDGRAIYRELAAKNSPMLKRLVFVTGDTLSPHSMEFLEASGVPFLAKPFLAEELNAIVAQALAAQHPAEENGQPRSFSRIQLPLREIV